MKKMRIFSVALAACMAVGAAAGCSGGGDKGDYAVKVGILAPTSGAVSSYGQAAKNGAELAIKHANESKMFDKEIVSVHMDEKGKAEEAVTAFDRLVNEQKIDVLIGDVTSGPSIDVAKEAASVGIPMMTPTGTAAAITEGKDNVFRACFLDATQAKAMADYAANELSAQKVAVLYDITDDYSLGVAESFKAEAEANGLEVVAFESFQSTDTDFKSQLSKIAAADPDALYVPSYYNTNALIAIQAKEVGLDAQLLGADGWDGVLSALDENNKSAVEGVVFTNHFTATDPDAKVQDFVTRYREAYGSDPSSFAALGYDAGMMLFQAIEAAGTTDSAAVNEALANLQYEGVTGAIHYEGSGDPVKDVKFVTVKDGAYALVENGAEEAPAEEPASEEASEEAAA